MSSIGNPGSVKMLRPLQRPTQPLPVLSVESVQLSIFPPLTADTLVSPYEDVVAIQAVTRSNEGPFAGKRLDCGNLVYRVEGRS